MPAFTTIALFLGAGLGLVVIPGPNIVYIVTRSVDQGRRAGLVSALGVETATLVHVTAAALGLSALLLSSALAFTVVKYVGAAYLIFLGLRTLLSRQPGHQEIVVEPKPLSRIYVQGVVVNLLNPKTALFFFAFLPNLSILQEELFQNRFSSSVSCSMYWASAMISSMLCLLIKSASGSKERRSFSACNGMSPDVSIWH